MEAVQLIKLFDSCWSELEIFKTKPNPNPNSPTYSSNPDHDFQSGNPKPEFSRIPTITRSMSCEQFISSPESSKSDPLSGDSTVLHAPKLTTIFSGKEVTEEEGFPETHEHIEVSASKNSTSGKSMTRRRKSESKSLTQLEFEELKGFMDLGFVFSEKDKDSSLASIIPGLKKLDDYEERDDDDFDDSPIRRRPYLSESWQVADMGIGKNPLLMNWRIPTSLENELDIKNNLKWWAHTVASAVR